MRTRGAVLREMGLPAPYAESRPLEIAELELDPPGPGELLVRVRAAGLCHSDLSVIDGSRPRVMPMVLGHEAAGEVVEAGPGVAGFAQGDHVVLAFVPTCGECGPCRAGRVELELGDLQRPRLRVGRGQPHLAQDGAADPHAASSDDTTRRSSAARMPSGIGTGRRASRSTKTWTNQPSAAGSSLPSPNSPIS